MVFSGLVGEDGVGLVFYCGFGLVCVGVFCWWGVGKFIFMDIDLLVGRVGVVLGRELVRRLLVRYFVGKGVGDFGDRVVPVQVGDLGGVPGLVGKVEVVPYVVDVFPESGGVRLGWNLFVLGCHRLFLGESFHASLVDVDQVVRGPLCGGGGGGGGVGGVTVGEVVDFVVGVLGGDREGVVGGVGGVGGVGPVGLGGGLGDQSGYFRRGGRPVY